MTKCNYVETDTQVEIKNFEIDNYRYAYSVSSTAIDADALCKKKSNYVNQWASGTEGFPPKFIRRYEQAMYGQDINNVDICINNTRKLAIVKFQIATQIINRIKKQQRVTNADIISNIGMKIYSIKTNYTYLI